ncbi:hypothetical protein KIN20_028284, partial [Parelaphostrongylus tenuis]
MDITGEEYDQPIQHFTLTPISSFDQSSIAKSDMPIRDEESNNTWLKQDKTSTDEKYSSSFINTLAWTLTRHLQ